jgi:MoaA/NifB/PqqE/SkfB family radical SAM enzyme
VIHTPRDATGTPLKAPEILCPRPDETADGEVSPAERLARLRQEIREARIRLDSAPATINIELTGRCNYKPACTFCVGKNTSGYQEPGNMSSELLDHYWPDLLRSQRVNDCSYGEPLLYPRFDEVIERLAVAGVKFGFTTNGLLLTERRARFFVRHADTVQFIVSLNAATPETYWRLHGQDFGKVIRNVERFVELHRAHRPGEALPLFLSFIVMRSNREEVPGFLRTAMRLGLQHVMLRHLFDLRVGEYSSDNFGQHFAYENERLPLADYLSLEHEVRESAEFAGLEIHATWNGKDSFIAEQAEPGVDIACLFPWKFLCVRPLHDTYTPCVYLKKTIAPPSATSIDEVWNGEVMVGIRRSLAAGDLPDFCMTYGDACPIVLKRRVEASVPFPTEAPSALPPPDAPPSHAWPRRLVVSLLMPHSQTDRAPGSWGAGTSGHGR